MWRKLFFVAGLLLAGNASAGANDVMVDKVWMRESVPGQISATVQLNLYVTKRARLLSVSSPVADSGEIEEAARRGGKIITVAKDSQPLDAHSTIIFGTKGLYLNLIGLKQPLHIGDKVPVTLKIEIAGKVQTVNVEAEVRPLELSYKHYNDPTVKDHR
ncbi:MAG TPA: copper chaperone PCu(A)C [Sideroxyarcus sp.]|nr:copper chaperone PCu(A)C [Sideroxyarcus sp.]